MIEVAIIGGGPVGLTLANILGRRGVSVVVCEKQARPYPLPRAIHFDAETMRVFQQAGVAEAILPHTLVGQGMLFKSMDGETLIDWSRAQEVGPQGWYESYRFYQPGIEQALRDALAAYPHVQLRTGVEVTDVAQDPKRVVLTTTEGEIEARYAVACDGAGSETREALGLSLEDLGFNERWLVVDMMLKRPRPDLGDHSVQFCHPERPATYVRGVGGWRRWEMRLDQSRPDPDEAEIWENLSRWITPDDAALERAAVYTFRSALAPQWRDGHVMLAGDAAHQMPPFMGQGMCAGVRDAGNLGWKLERALRGDDAILDTYGSERGPHVREFIEMTMRLGRLINQTAAGEAPKGRMKSIWPALGEGLGVRDEIAGRLAPQPLVGGALADDVASAGFYVLSLKPIAARVPVFSEVGEWLEESGLFGAIVRPDGYVLEAAKDEAVLKEALVRYDDLLGAAPG
ncbi:MAG: bifunctional 3-(3-hydroxy-phenyl)propionate/3-hydroxycinnamic acid hydroxylase [Pseudomonadota bacterium]